MYLRTNASLLPVALLHSALNSAGVVFPGVPLLLEVGAMQLPAIVLAIVDRPALGQGWRAFAQDPGTSS